MSIRNIFIRISKRAFVSEANNWKALNKRAN